MRKRSHLLRTVEREEGLLLQLLDGGLFPFFRILYIKTDEVHGIADLGTVVQPEAEQQDIIVHKDIGHAESHAGHLVPDIGQQLRPQKRAKGRRKHIS